MTPDGVPEALVVMSRDVFDAQFDASRLTRLHALASVPDPVFADDLEDPALVDRLATVEVLLTGWGAPRLEADLLDRMPRLRAMLHCAGSVRALVSPAFWERGILATSAAEVNSRPVAEFTFAAIIMAGKKAPFLAADPDSRRLPGLIADRYGERSNFARTIGIVGFSRIGRRVLDLLQQLDDVTVLVADPYADPAEIDARGGVPATLAQMLSRVDVLSVHAPELPSTKHMIGATELATLRDHATVINTARGSLIDTDALQRECAAGRLNAILDVTDPEPLAADSVLYRLPNVMITPHLAGSLGSELFRMTDAALDELRRLRAGLPLREQITEESIRHSA